MNNYLKARNNDDGDDFSLKYTFTFISLRKTKMNSLKSHTSQVADIKLESRSLDFKLIVFATTP